MFWLYLIDPQLVLSFKRKAKQFVSRTVFQQSKLKENKKITCMKMDVTLSSTEKRENHYKSLIIGEKLLLRYKYDVMS